MGRVGFASNGQFTPLAQDSPYYADQRARASLGPSLALGMIGGGANFAERNAVGAAGGRMFQAGKPELNPSLMDELRSKLGPDVAKQYEPKPVVPEAAPMPDIGPIQDRMDRSLDILNAYVKGNGASFSEIGERKGVSRDVVAGIVTRANNGFYGEDIAANMRAGRPSTLDQMRYDAPGPKSTIGAQVIDLRSQGKSPAEIADQLGVSARTIYRHFAKQKSQ